jgi:RNase P/RNase MRP subunit POP5
MIKNLNDEPVLIRTIRVSGMINKVKKDIERGGINAANSASNDGI